MNQSDALKNSLLQLKLVPTPLGSIDPHGQHETNYGMRLHRDFRRFVEQSDYWQELLNIFRADERIKSLENKIISFGSLSTGFHERPLAQWYTWYAAKSSVNEAIVALETFLDSERIPVLNTLWVQGFVVEEPILLMDGIQIVPIEAMPDSADKERFLQERFRNASYPKAKTLAALVKLCHVKKLREKVDESVLETDADFFSSTKILREVSLLLNAVDGISCVPVYATTYVQDSVPFGPFGGQSGSLFSYDVSGGYPQSKIDSNLQPLIINLYSAFGKLATKEHARFSRALERISQAKRRFSLEDKLLDLCIALEMLLLSDNTSHNQLSLSFRLRGAWLISANGAERKLNYYALKDIYTYRSQVAHGGMLGKGKHHKVEVINSQVPKLFEIAESILQKLMLEGTPQWDDLILDFNEEPKSNNNAGDN